MTSQSSGSQRLIDYIAVYEPDEARFLRTSTGDVNLLDPNAKIPAKVSVKYPKVDYKDLEFPPSLELFVFPFGINLKVFLPPPYLYFLLNLSL